MEKKILFNDQQIQKLSKPSALLGIHTYYSLVFASSRYVLVTLLNKMSEEKTEYYIKDFWQKSFLAAKATLSATGLENIEQGKPYIFLSNHSSWMDIPAILGAVPSPIRMVSKEEIMNLPIVGKSLRDAGFIAINRRNKIQAISQLAEAKKHLSKGISIWMAPEGTRSKTNEIAPFKKGGFHLALELNLDIVPVYIEGAANVIPPGKIQANPYREICVHFLKPVKTDTFSKKNIHDLIKLVRDKIIEHKQKTEK